MNTEILCAIIESETENLRALAIIAGGHYSSFYRGANFDGVDLCDENLSDFDLTGGSFSNAIYNDRTRVDDKFRTILIKRGVWRPLWKRDGDRVGDGGYEPPAYLDLRPIEHPPPGVSARELTAWNAVRGHGSADAFELFLNYWPRSVFSSDARKYIGVIYEYIRQRAILQVESGYSASGKNIYDYIAKGESPRKSDVDYEISGKLNFHNARNPITDELKAIVRNRS